MKNTDRKISALIFSSFFLFDVFCLRYVLMNMSASQCPLLVLFEAICMLICGWIVIKAWQSTDSWTDCQKRTLLSMWGIYLTVNLVCAPMEVQIISTALSTINQLLSQNRVLALGMFVVKLILPGVALWFACRKRASATVVFEQAARPDELVSQEALERLTIRLDAAEKQE